MSHEILGLRGEGHAFKDRNWIAPSIDAILADPKKFVDQIPEDDRWNIYFTAHHVQDGMIKARTWNGQDIIPIDIDDIDVGKAEETAKFICEVIGIEFFKTGIICSGRGLQMFIKLESPIKETQYFLQNRELYKLIVMRVNQKLKDAQILGSMDPAVFSASRLLRMPGTINRKPHKGNDCEAYVINANMELQGFDLMLACGAPNLKKTDAIHKDAWAKFPAADQKAVVSECEFIKWAATRQNDVSEPQWKAMIGTVGFLPDGHKLVHEYSKDHRDYNRTETDFKFEQSVRMTGPRTCQSIDQLWPGCKSCPHYGKLKTPLQIQSPDYIATETHGFYKKWITKNGDERMEPAYEDLVKYFRKEKGEFFAATSNVFYTYSFKKNYWETIEPLELMNFAYVNMKPTPRSNICEEFKKSISSSVVRSNKWMNETTEKKLNLQNGVLDIKTGELKKHSYDYGFMSILPYEYDENAEAPRFEQFLDEVTKGRKDLQNLLEEFMGYCISGDRCWIHKGLILIGEGRNGKSTLNKVLKGLVGPGYYSSLNLEALNSDQKRYMLEGKLFNIGDENSPEGLLDSSIFKSLVAGEEVDIKLVYKQPHTIINKAKMIFNCNAMPQSKDTSLALFERLIFVPFDAKFTADLGNLDPLIDQKLASELPGILNICLRAYKRLLERGHLPNAEASTELLNQYIEYADTTTEWFEKYITKAEHQAHFVDINDAYQSYQMFCDSLKIRRETRIEFFRKINKVCEDKKIQVDRNRIEGKRATRIFGVQLKTGF